MAVKLAMNYSGTWRSNELWTTVEHGRVTGSEVKGGPDLQRVEDDEEDLEDESVLVDGEHPEDPGQAQDGGHDADRLDDRPAHTGWGHHTQDGVITHSMGVITQIALMIDLHTHAPRAARYSHTQDGGHDADRLDDRPAHTRTARSALFSQPAS